MGPVVATPLKWPTKAALVPYDADGVRLPPGSNAPRMWLDLADRQKVPLTRPPSPALSIKEAEAVTPLHPPRPTHLPDPYIGKKVCPP